MSRRLIPAKNSPEKDLIFTPPDLARKIVEHFDPFGDCLEPCAGQGAFFNAMKDHAGVINVDYWELSENRDFLLQKFPVRTIGYDWCITNFPWSKYRAFLNKTMSLCQRIVTLAPTVHILGSRARMDDIEKAGFFINEICRVERPKEWSSSGFDYSAILLTKWRGDCKITKL